MTNSSSGQVSERDTATSVVFREIITLIIEKDKIIVMQTRVVESKLEGQ